MAKKGMKTTRHSFHPREGGEEGGSERGREGGRTLAKAVPTRSNREGMRTTRHSFQLTGLGSSEGAGG